MRKVDGVEHDTKMYLLHCINRDISGNFKYDAVCEMREDGVFLNMLSFSVHFGATSGLFALSVFFLCLESIIDLQIALT